MDELLGKVKMRLPEAEEELLQGYIATISDRLCLRLGTDTLPVPFRSICVDAVVKMYRRTYYEGISSEGASSASALSTTFVEDILAEYGAEIASWREGQEKKDGTGKVVRFL